MIITQLWNIPDFIENMIKVPLASIHPLFKQGHWVVTSDRIVLLFPPPPCPTH